MPLTNPYGDMEISEPQALRALAHPTRLAILERLQRYGPSTATQLAPHVGATPSVVSWHLRHLARFGFVRDWDGAGTKRERGWQAVSRGYRFVPREGDLEAHEAARQLERERLIRANAIPFEWLDADEPALPVQWRENAGLANTRVRLTLDELIQVESAIEELLAPYVRRRDEDQPEGARDVRMLRYVLPEATGALPEATGALPEATGALPEATGALPEATGALPEATGALPEPPGAQPEPPGAQPEPTGAQPESLKPGASHTPPEHAPPERAKPRAGRARPARPRS